MVESLLDSLRGFQVTPSTSGHDTADSPPACLTSYSPRFSQSPKATLGRQKLGEGTPEFTPSTPLPTPRCETPEPNLTEMQIPESVPR